MNRSIEQKVLKFISANELIQSGDKILIALSGGPDSIFLLSFLIKFRNKFKIELGAFHLNHGLRGKKADEDENFCRRFCLKNKIEFYSSKKNIKLIANQEKISVEEAGRIIRYEELNRCAVKNSFNKIATAHNIDDNTETVLLNLIKGAGLKGLTGIPVKRKNIIRPMLSISKTEILDYLKRNKIKYRIDESNLSIDYERNYLRNKIIPELSAKLNPSLNNSLLRSASILKQYYCYLIDQVKSEVEKTLSENEDEIILKDSVINSIDKRLRGLFIYEALNKKFNLELNNEKINKILELFERQAGRKLELDNGVIVFRERNGIIIKHRVFDSEVSITLKPGDSKKVNDKTISIKRKVKIIVKLNSDPGSEFVDADKCDPVFKLRNWKQGDRFFPIGMKGSKKISDYLTDKKIDTSERKNKLVLTNSGKIVWVVGLRIDDRFKITNNTKKVYELCFR
jgi:tRNA(Ile)-lysidine synthase